MATLSGVWSREELDRFLRDVTVPLRLGCRRPGGDLWMLSLWYRYRDGTFQCATSADADVVSYLRTDPDVSFEVSTNDPPYRGVRGNGTANLDADEEKSVLRDLLERYLGTTDTPLAQRLLSPDRDEVTLTIAPARLHSWDYSDRM